MKTKTFEGTEVGDRAVIEKRTSSASSTSIAQLLALRECQGAELADLRVRIERCERVLESIEQTVRMLRD